MQKTLIDNLDLEWTPWKHPTGIFKMTAAAAEISIGCKEWFIKAKFHFLRMLLAVQRSLDLLPRITTGRFLMVPFLFLLVWNINTHFELIYCQKLMMKTLIIKTYFFGNVIRFAEESSRFLIDFRTIKFVGFLHSVEGKSNELSSVKLNVKLMSKPVYPN